VLPKPRDPETKELVERHHGWFQTSFMPGRDFVSPTDFNEQFTDWVTRLTDAHRAGRLPTN